MAHGTSGVPQRRADAVTMSYHNLELTHPEGHVEARYPA